MISPDTTTAFTEYLEWNAKLNRENNNNLSRVATYWDPLVDRETPGRMPKPDPGRLAEKQENANTLVTHTFTVYHAKPKPLRSSQKAKASPSESSAANSTTKDKKKRRRPRTYQ